VRRRERRLPADLIAAAGTAMKDAGRGGDPGMAAHGRELWSSRLAFILAAVGGAVGFANFWRFPSLAGENGGAAFILVYIGCVILIGIPIIAAELILGRRGGASPINSMRRLVADEGASRGWLLIGWLSIIGPFLALTYYSVVSSWTLDYLVQAVAGRFTRSDPARSQAAFAELLDSPQRLMWWHALFLALTGFIVARGVRRGLESANKLMMPALFVLLLALVGFAAVAGDFAAACRFMFTPDFSRITLPVAFLAMGQAFFSLSVGGGFLMTYSAYLPPGVSLPQAAAAIGVIDTLVAILAGLAIFPVVFAFGLAPNSGPGLMFETLPVAFGVMPAGALVGSAFFVLLLFAALTSSISMLEPLVSFAEEHRGWTRRKATLCAGALAWAIGVAFVLSFNVWSDVRPLAGIAVFADKNLFGIMDLLVASLILPSNGLLIALCAGWMLAAGVTRVELAFATELIFRLWLWIVRYFAPLAIAVVLTLALKENLGL
jgi:NSS family neurotransmitter:Na+ symporter